MKLCAQVDKVISPLLRREFVGIVFCILAWNLFEMMVGRMMKRIFKTLGVGMPFRSARAPATS